MKAAEKLFFLLIILVLLHWRSAYDGFIMIEDAIFGIKVLKWRKH